MSRSSTFQHPQCRAERSGPQCTGHAHAQDYLTENLPDLLNKHVFGGEAFGDVIIELGRSETFLLKCSRGQAGKMWDGVRTIGVAIVDVTILEAALARC